MKFKHLVKPQGTLGWIGDMLMLPIMFLVHWSLKESWQRTHFWNNIKIKDSDTIQNLRMDAHLIPFGGDASAASRWLLGFIPIFHIPIFGGWKKFVVLEPVSYEEEWFVGWYPGDVSAGISRIPLKGSVRVLIGRSNVSFFGLDKEGNSIHLVQTGKGYVGKAGKFSHIPLR